MKTFTLQYEQVLPISIEKAWEFFANPKNLEHITPKALNFKIVSKVPNEVHEGLFVEYTVSPLMNFPMKWLSKITDVEKPFKFTDEQIQGPYSTWRHLHTFHEVPQGVKVVDQIEYSLPIGIFENRLNAQVVLPKLNEIFAFRSQTLSILFGEAK
jgi:ligand-binding SRPBCC domain-containing protein